MDRVFFALQTILFLYFLYCYLIVFIAENKIYVPEFTVFIFFSPYTAAYFLMFYFYHKKVWAPSIEVFFIILCLVQSLIILLISG